MVELGLQSQQPVSRICTLNHTASQENGIGKYSDKNQKWAIRAERRGHGIQNHLFLSQTLQMSSKSSFFAEGVKEKDRGREGGKEREKGQDAVLSLCSK